MGGVFISAGMPALPLGFPGKGEHGGEPPHSEIKSEYKFKERIFELCNFWMAQQSPWLRTYPVYSLCANSCCQPFYVTERQNEFFARTSFCAQQKCLIHVSRRNVRALMFGNLVCIQLNSRVSSLFFLHSNRRRVKEVAVVPSCGACPEKCSAWGVCENYQEATSIS